MLCPWRTATVQEPFLARPGSYARTDFQECAGTHCAAYVPEHKHGSITIPERCLRARELRGELSSNNLPDASDANVGNKPEGDGWVRVSEKMPEYDTPILMAFEEGDCVVSGFVTKGICNHDIWCSFTDGDWYTDIDTAPVLWRPTPKKAEEVTE